MDNRFPRFVEQLEVFFWSGVIDPARTTLLCRDYRENRETIARFALRWRLPVARFGKVRDIPRLDGKVVLYPFNGQLNMRLLKNDHAAHVFLTHGESNKAATIHRVVRLYDLVLAPGPIAVDRYVEFEALTRQEAADRVLMVGPALTDPLPCECKGSPAEDGGPRALLYMPTWEGGTDSERYTSVEHDATAHVLVSLCKRLDLERVLIRPHPNLGQRVRNVASGLDAMVLQLRDSGLTVVCRGPDVAHGASPLVSWNIAFAAVDVSAAEAIVTARGIRSVVLVRRGYPIYAPLSYLECRHRAMILLDDPQSIDAALPYIGSPTELEDLHEYRRRLFAVDRLWDSAGTASERFGSLLRLAIARMRANRVHPLFPGQEIASDELEPAICECRR